MLDLLPPGGACAPEPAAPDEPARAAGGRTLVVADPAMRRLYSLVERLAASDLPVLVSGETGTGKALAAAALHHWSPRRGRPLLTLHCVALQEALVEGELLGRGRSGPGLLEAAGGGTVLLDEVGELSLSAQGLLLRALETSRERAIDVRLVAATHRDLEAEVRAGRFRPDLSVRLSAGRVRLPPLRERKGEVPALARRFLDDACARLGRRTPAIGEEAARALLDHPWPGNVRELKNLMEYAAAVADGEALQPRHLAERLKGGRPARPPRTFRPVAEEIRELERARMAEALERCGGNRTRAAAAISMPLRTFVSKLKQYRLG